MGEGDIMGWGSAQSLRGRGSHVQMRIQPEIERNFANERTFWALRFLDPTAFGVTSTTLV